MHVEGVPFARDGAHFTRDFEDLVAWLATKTDKTATCRLTRIDWQTIGRVIERVADERVSEDRLSELFEISIDEVAWREGHRYRGAKIPLPWTSGYIALRDHATAMDHLEGLIAR